MKTLSTHDAENILSSIVEYVKNPKSKNAKDAIAKSIDTLTEAISDQKIEDEKIDFTRIDNDVNGNPRYVVHFLSLLNDGEHGYENALKRAKKIGGRKYHNKKFGGGIVFQSYNTQELEKQIKELRDQASGKLGATKKNSTESILEKIGETKTIDEKTLKLLLKRKNAGEKFDDSVIWDNEIELSKDQSEKGLKWLKNLWKSPTGKERSNNPFGYREEKIIENFSGFYLRGFHDAGTYGNKFYVPLYMVAGDGTSMEYYVSGGKIHIVG